MTLRSHRPKRSLIGRIFIRRDVRRAFLAVIGIVFVSVPVFFSHIGEQPDRQGEFVFGRQSRVGAIQFVPLVGELCRQSSFDNDTGMIWPIQSAPCFEVENAEEKAIENLAGSKVAIIGERFRK